MPDLVGLVAVARSLLPPGVAIAATDPRQMHTLLPGETLPGAIPARLREFSAGRHAAHKALEILGFPDIPVLPAHDRSPIWPQGIAGSITHSRTHCLVAASLALAGLGLDLEEDEPLPDDLWSTILLPKEICWAKDQPAPGHAAKLIFSAKEAAYKAQYAHSKTLLGFDNLHIDVHGSHLEATFTTDIRPFRSGQILHGRYAFTAGHILTAFTL